MTDENRSLKDKIRDFLEEKGVYVVAFSYPVVPKGKARIRTQVCASHTKEQLKYVVDCFKAVRDEMNK